jgi:hypothetical protein
MDSKLGASARLLLALSASLLASFAVVKELVFQGRCIYLPALLASSSILPMNKRRKKTPMPIMKKMPMMLIKP